jgi:hypothetical protein
MAPRSSSSLLTAGLAIAGALYGTVHAQEATADGGHDSVIWHVGAVVLLYSTWAHAWRMIEIYSINHKY